MDELIMLENRLQDYTTLSEMLTNTVVGLEENFRNYFQAYDVINVTVKVDGIEIITKKKIMKSTINHVCNRLELNNKQHKTKKFYVYNLTWM